MPIALGVAKIYIRLSGDPDLADALGDAGGILDRVRLRLGGSPDTALAREIADQLAAKLGDDVFARLTGPQQESVLDATESLVLEHVEGDLGWALRLDEVDAYTYMMRHGGARLRAGFDEFGDAFDSLLRAVGAHLDASLPRGGQHEGLERLFRRLEEMSSEGRETGHRTLKALEETRQFIKAISEGRSSSRDATDRAFADGGILHGVPPKPTHLASPRARLQADANARACTPGSLLFLSGPVGVGKSQLAARALRAATKASATGFWIRADTPTRLREEYAAIARKIGLAGPESTDTQRDAQAFLQALEQRHGWVVVLDGVVMESAHLAPWLPRGRGSTIVTTWVRGLGEHFRDIFDGGLFAIQPVEAFEEPEAVAYLEGRFTHAQRRVPKRAQLRELVRLLACLPMALDAAATLLVPLQGATIAQLLGELRRPGARLDDVLGLDPDEGRSLAGLWRVALDAAIGADPRGLAESVMAVAVHLDPTYAPHAVWASDAVRAYLAGAGGEVPKRRDVLDTLRYLADRSLLEQVRQDKTGYRLHSLAQRLIMESLAPDVVAAAADAAASALIELWDDPRLDYRARKTIMHNATWLLFRDRDQVVVNLPGYLADPTPHPIILKYLDELVEGGDVDVARRLCQELLDELDAGGGTTSRDILRLRVEQASMLGETGRAREAAHALARLVKLVDKLTPETSDELALRAWYCRARWALKSGQVETALDHFRVLAQAYRAVEGPTSGNYFKCRYQYGRALGQHDRILLAIRVLQRLARIQRYAPRVARRHVLKTRSELASWVGHSGDAAKAVRVLARLLPGYVDTYGVNGRQTLVLRRRHAYWLGKSGDVAGAAELSRQVAEDSNELLGNRHKDTIVAERNYAYWQGAVGFPNLAQAILRTLRVRAVDALGPEHVETLVTERTLGVVAGDGGDPNAAEAILSSVLKRMTDTLGPEHPETLDCNRFRVDWLGNAGKPRQAVDGHDALLKMLVGTAEPLSPRVVNTMKNREKWRVRMGHPTHALENLRLVADATIRTHGLGHPQTYSVWEWQADAIGARGEARAAALLFRRFAEMMAKRGGPDQIETLLAHNGYLYWLGRTGREGATMARRGLRKLTRKLDQLQIDHPLALHIHSNYAFVLGTTGSAKEAVERYEQLLPRVHNAWVDSHPDALLVRSNCERWRAEFEPEPAVEGLKKLIEDMSGGFRGQEGCLEEGHPQLLAARGRLAYAEYRMGDQESAIGRMRDLVLQQRRFLEPHHPKTESSKQTLRQWLQGR